MVSRLRYREHISPPLPSSAPSSPLLSPPSSPSLPPLPSLPLQPVSIALPLRYYDFVYGNPPSISQAAAPTPQPAQSNIDTAPTPQTARSNVDASIAEAAKPKSKCGSDYLEAVELLDSEDYVECLERIEYDLTDHDSAELTRTQPKSKVNNMPTVRYLEDVAHVVLSGKLDGEAKTSFITLLRNGKRFHITVHAEDVQDSPFEKDWKAIVKESDQDMAPAVAWSRWDRQCDLMINQSMTTLKRLAPTQPHWETLHDYLHIPSYNVKLALGPESDVVEGQVLDGPVDEPGYNFQPIHVDSMKASSECLPLHKAEDLVVIDADKDLAMKPCKVRAPDGQTQHFLGFVTSGKSADTGEEENSSFTAINAYLQLHELNTHQSDTYPSGVPAVLGVVTDGSLIAGLLLTYIGNGKPFASILDGISTVQQLTEVGSKVAGWRSRTVSITSTLHDQKFAGTDDLTGCGISEWNLLVDPDNKLWLPLTSGLAKKEEHLSDFQAGVDLDDKAVDRLYREWLPEKLEILRGQLGKS
ncbi:hypothetical protein LTR86_000505 [Recurvomyces mirabilis]|nr:hypothetical protein LTR86_000505 [Recurvomyces mirabilis]